MPVGNHGRVSAEPNIPCPPGGARTTRRRGRMSAAKHAAIAELGPRWSVTADQAADDDALARAFGRRAPRLLDVGTGTGEATRAWAADHPDHDVIAVELHRPGLARLLGDLEQSGPTNVRVLEADVTVLLDAMAPGVIDAVRALFPDPWPKRRHVARRLVDRALVGRVADLLPVDGWLHLATDWADYADQMREALAAEPRLTPVGPEWLPPDDAAEASYGDTARPGRAPAVPRWRSARPPRPETVYERRGRRAGRPITDLVARRTR